MSLQTVSDFELPTRSHCPHCIKAEGFRHVTSDEYNIFQSGTANIAGIIGAVAVTIGKEILSGGAVKGLLRIAGQFTGTLHLKSLWLMVCNQCGSFVIQCSNCKNLQKGYSGMMKNQVSLRCKECSNDLCD